MGTYSNCVELNPKHKNKIFDQAIFEWIAALLRLEETPPRVACQVRPSLACGITHPPSRRMAVNVSY